MFVCTFQYASLSMIKNGKLHGDSGRRTEDKGGGMKTKRILRDFIQKTIGYKLYSIVSIKYMK